MGPTTRGWPTALAAMLIAAAAAPSAVASNEVVGMWTRIYRSAETLERRHEVALALVDDGLLVPPFAPEAVDSRI